MKKISLTAWIFIGMAAGVGLGIVAPDFAKQLGLMSTVFLRLIRSIIAPLLFGTLVAGIAGGGDLKNMGRIGAKAILYFEIVTTFALFLGLGVVNLVRPGEGVPIARTAADAYAACDAVVFPSTWEGFGNPTIESIAARRPLAAFHYPVLHEITAYGLRFFELDDAAALARFIRDPDARLLDTNLRRARTAFSIAELPAAIDAAFNAHGWLAW